MGFKRTSKSCRSTKRQRATPKNSSPRFTAWNSSIEIYRLNLIHLELIINFCKKTLSAAFNLKYQNWNTALAMLKIKLKLKTAFVKQEISKYLCKQKILNNCRGRSVILNRTPLIWEKRLIVIQLPSQNELRNETGRCNSVKLKS